MKSLKISFITIAVFLFLFTAFVPRTVRAAGFLKIEGVKGEATDKDHDGWIDIVTYSSGVSGMAEASSTTGSSGRSGPGSMTITKKVDVATPALKSQCASGAFIPKIELQVQRTDGKPGYLVYEMNNVQVASVTPGGSGGEDRLTENVTLNFSGISWEYTSIKDSTGGGETDFGWDIETNELK